MDVTFDTLKHFFLNSCHCHQPESQKTTINSFKNQNFDILLPWRKWLNNIEVNDPKLAHRLCRSIPAQCPFQRKITLFGRTLISIPPLCKLNPLYEELMALRFRAICYLAEECGEDVSRYC